jgi:hypothetical protein
MANTRSAVVRKLEREIAFLPFEEKLWLLAQIAQQIQPTSFGKSGDGTENELGEMAGDPEIQREIATIELEFATTVMDGLGE